MHTWATTDGAALRQRIERDLGRYAGSPAGAELEKAAKAIPDGLLTRSDVAEKLGDGLADPAVRRAVLDSGWSFRPEIERPLTELRQAVTRAQNDAVDSLGSIAETEHHKLRQEIATNLNRSLEKHLDKVAAAGPEAAANVTQIRNSDAIQSALLALQGGLEEAQGRAATEGIGLGKRTAHIAPTLLAGEQALSALTSAAHGNVAGAAGHAALAAGTAVAPGAVAGVKRAANQALAEAAYNGRNVALRKVAGAASKATGAARDTMAAPARTAGAALAGRRLGGAAADVLGGGE
jgi:hypothetical protein